LRNSISSQPWVVYCSALYSAQSSQPSRIIISARDRQPGSGEDNADLSVASSVRPALPVPAAAADAASDDDGLGNDAEWCEAVNAVRHPVWNVDTCDVVDPQTNAVLGRIKPMHVGTEREAVSVYCRIHQCRVPLQRLHTAPSTAQILEWFWQGQQLGRGKEHQSEHVRMFRQLTKRAALP